MILKDILQNIVALLEYRRISLSLRIYWILLILSSILMLPLMQGCSFSLVFHLLLLFYLILS